MSCRPIKYFAGKEAVVRKLRDTVSSTGGFIAKAKRYTDITELTPGLLRLFIQKIVVQEGHR